MSKKKYDFDGDLKSPNPSAATSSTQDMIDKLCTAVYSKDVSAITLLANKQTINGAGLVRRNNQFARLGEGLEQGMRVDPPIRLAADRQPACPLHYAAAVGDIGIIDLLLSYGANKNIECHLHMLPWEIAKVNGFHKSVARRLRPRYCGCFCVNNKRLPIPTQQKAQITLDDEPI